MPTVQGATLEIIEALSNVTGINNAPDTPIEQVTAWPQAMVYNSDGQSQNEPPDIEKSLHTVEIAVIMPLNDLRMATKTMLPLYELIVKAIWEHRNSRTSKHYRTFENILYTFGVIDWPQGQAMYGFLMTLTDVKIWNNL